MIETKNSIDSKPMRSICAAIGNIAPVFMPSAQRLCWPSRRVVSMKRMSGMEGNGGRLEYWSDGVLE